MGDKLLSIARTFHGGIHPADEKELTEEFPIRDYMDPQGDMIFPMQQHLGAPCQPIVAKGDRVLAGSADRRADGLCQRAGVFQRVRYRKGCRSRCCIRTAAWS